MKKKNNSATILTVAIPTYNRSRTLEKILHQLHKEKNQSFQIIVSDNDSSDNTEDMIKKIQKSMRNLRYNKNTENIGFSGNIIKLYELAKTRYVWFLSDDEIIFPGSIDKILKAIIKYQPVVALFNHQWEDPYGRKQIDGVSKDIIHEDINGLENYKSLMRTGFISIIVVEKRLSLDILKKTDYKNNLFVQLTLSLLLLSDKFKFCEIATPIVFRDPTYNLGEFFKFVFTDPLRAVFIVDHKFDNKKFINWAKNGMFKSFQLYLCQKIGLFKFYGRPTTETIRRIKKYYDFSGILIFLFPVFHFLIPAFLVKFIYRIQLVKLHGSKKGARIYKKNLNRIYKIKRTSGFTTHR